MRWRLLTAQIVAVACFILFPLRFTFVRPEATGLAGLLFAALASFDKPFNQAPSLHIALLVHHLGAVCPARAALGAVADAAVVCGACRLGADDIPAPFHRHADRRAARVPVSLAVAG